MCVTEPHSTMIKWDDLSTNLLTAFVAGIVSVALAAQFKRSRLAADIVAMEVRLNRILDLKAGSRPDLQEIASLRAEVVAIAEEIRESDSGWFRLGRAKRDRFARWRAEFERLETERRSEGNLRALGYKRDSSAFVRGLIRELEQFRCDLWWGDFILP